MRMRKGIAIVSVSVALSCLSANACAVDELDDTGKACTSGTTCPSGRPCIRGTCGGHDDGDAATVDGNDSSSSTTDSGGGNPNDGPSVDAGPPLQMYTYSLQTSVWSVGPLSNSWNGDNAPPDRGIGAVVQLTDEDRLLVFTDAGKYHLRSNGKWQPPESIEKQWLPLKVAPRSASHLPYAYKVTNDPQAPNEETIILIENPKSYVFTYKPNDAVVFVREQTIDPGDGAVVAPAVTGHIQWSFEILALGHPNANERYQFWDLYDDKFLYETNANIEVKRWPLADSPFWTGHANAPPPTGVAAYWDNGTNTIHVIGP